MLGVEYYGKTKGQRYPHCMHHIGFDIYRINGILNSEQAIFMFWNQLSRQEALERVFQSDNHKPMFSMSICERSSIIKVVAW